MTRIEKESSLIVKRRSLVGAHVGRGSYGYLPLGKGVLMRSLVDRKRHRIAEADRATSEVGPLDMWVVRGMKIFYTFVEIASLVGLPLLPN